MNAFTLEHFLQWKKDTYNYAKNDADRSKCINAIIISYSTDEINIRVNEKFDLLTILDQVGIVRLKLMLDEMLFMS